MNGRVRHHTEGQREADAMLVRGNISPDADEKYMCDATLDAALV